MQCSLDDDDESTIISIWQRIAIDMLNRRLNIYEQGWMDDEEAAVPPLD